MVFLLSVVALLTSFVCSTNALTCYISPDPVTKSTCSGNGSRLSPCYSLQQLQESELVSNGSDISLLFLPGTHMLPQNITLSDMSQVNMSSWSQQQAKQLIKCSTHANFIFKNVKNLNIDSLKFSSCSTWIRSNISSFEGHIVISLTMFTESKDYAVAIEKNTEIHISFTLIINSCTFALNNGSVSCNSGPHSIPAINTNLTITDCVFSNNTRTGYGGVVNVYRVNLELQNSFLANNMALNDGILDFSSSSALINGTVFEDNYSADSGGAISQSKSFFEIKQCVFSNNTAMVSGGAVYSRVPRKFIVHNSYFLDNYANISGGAIYSEFVHLYVCWLEGNSAGSTGGAVHLYEDIDDSDAIKDGYSRIAGTTISFNYAGVNGGGIYCEKPKKKSEIEFIEGYSEINHAVNNGGFMYLLGCTVSVEGRFDMIGNSAVKGGAIFANNSKVFHQYISEVYLVNNTAEESGGAMFLAMSRISIINGSQLTFNHNRVTSTTGKGGAIYIQDSNCESLLDVKQYCSIDVPFNNERQKLKQLFFHNNSADTGSVLYGGLLDRCFHGLYHDESNKLGIEYFKQISQYEPRTLAITSDPVKVCFCYSNYQPDCSPRRITATKMRGQTVEALVTSVDQDKNPIESVIQANYQKTGAQLGKGEGRTRVPNCTTLHYHIFSVDASARLILQPEGFCERSPLSNLVIDIEIVSCSRGFEQDEDRCVCDRRLRIHLNITSCFLDAHSVQRKGPFWVRYKGDFLKMATHCPLDYCFTESDNVSLLFPDEQCANNRSGILCGGCQQNHSIALGSSKCLPCANKYMWIWLVLVFAVAGIALVSLLLVCNMTVSHGTLNGLIFYANVISISGFMSLDNCPIHPLLTVFIAWVNLDVGIETCFYSGMDTYQKTWLQFAFPVYIITLVAAILVASYYSSTAMKVFGRNNIAILATLFLLSYSKALKNIISALVATRVLASDADNVSAPILPYKVWAYDGNIEYLKGRHTPLFAVSLIFLLIFFLPYTLILTFGQCLRSLPLRMRYLQKLLRSTAFISIMDAYHAPYSRRHRYWTGLLLLTRCILFLAFTTNYNDAVVTNSYTTTIVVLGILLLKTCSTKCYRKQWMNFLELSYLCNLEVLSATLSYLKDSEDGGGSMQCKSVTISIAISFAIFVSIVMYHAYLQFQRTRYYKVIKEVIVKWLPAKAVPAESTMEPIIHEVQHPTSSVVELREELLSSTESD